MGRAEQAERAMDREVAALDRDYDEGRLTATQHRNSIRELERDLRGEYEQDQQDALDAVRHEWGW